MVRFGERVDRIGTLFDVIYDRRSTRASKWLSAVFGVEAQRTVLSLGRVRDWYSCFRSIWYSSRLVLHLNLAFVGPVTAFSHDELHHLCRAKSSSRARSSALQKASIYSTIASTVPSPSFSVYQSLTNLNSALSRRSVHYCWERSMPELNIITIISNLIWKGDAPTSGRINQFLSSFEYVGFVAGLIACSIL